MEHLRIPPTVGRRKKPVHSHSGSECESLAGPKYTIVSEYGSRYLKILAISTMLLYSATDAMRRTPDRTTVYCTRRVQKLLTEMSFDQRIVGYPVVHSSPLIRQVASLHASGLFQHPPPNRTKRRPALRYSNIQMTKAENNLVLCT